MSVRDAVRRAYSACHKATPGPWYDDGYRVHGPTSDPDPRNGMTILTYKNLDLAEFENDDNGFFVMAARALLHPLAEMAEYAYEQFGYMMEDENYPEHLRERAETSRKWMDTISEGAARTYGEDLPELASDICHRVLREIGILLGTQQTSGLFKNVVNTKEVQKLPQKVRELQEENRRLKEELAAGSPEEPPLRAAKPDDILYGLEDQEILDASIHDVVEQFIDGAYPEFPHTVEVLEYEKFEDIDAESWGEGILETLLEQLDDNYAHPDFGQNGPTERMERAATEFVEKVLEDYQVSLYKPSGTKHIINCRAWCRQNAPDWLPGEEGE